MSDSKLDLPDLPTVPSDTPPNDATPDQKNDENDDDLDFDDLTRRFEALKKKKWKKDKEFFKSVRHVKYFNFWKY